MSNRRISRIVVKPVDDPIRNPLSSQPESSGSSSPATSQLNHSEVVPKDQPSQKNRRHSRNRRGRGVKHQFVQRVPAPAACLTKCGGEEDHRVEGGGGIEVRVPSDCGEGTSGTKEKEENGGVGVGVEEFDDVGRRLEELRLGVEEAELSEEQLRVNDQAQEDELLVLESIYGDDIFVLDRQNDLRTLQIHIHIEVPNELTVSVNLKTSALETQNDDSPEFLYSFKVEHLPPIILTCLLPKSYPSHLPPQFTISVQWLKSAKISHLCHMLDSIWNEQSGQEVIYQWVDWLQSSSLSHLQFDQEIKLSPYNERDIGDRRAISGSVSPDIDISSLKRYNDEQRHENFRKNFHECCICAGEFPGTYFARLPCQHFFCLNCMRTFSNMHVKEGTVTKLQCPNPKCGGMIPPGLLRRLLGEEEFEHWESLMLQKALESMSDVCYCPRCETICIKDEDNHALCPKCYFSFCTLCRDKRHVGVECMTPEMKLRFLQERQYSSNLNDDQRYHERELINELLSVKEIHHSAKQCPSCMMAISRTEGCNKVVCNNCGQSFCYRCNKAIDEYGCDCRDGQSELFPQEEMQNCEEGINDSQVVGQMQAELFDDNSPNCFYCGQIKEQQNSSQLEDYQRHPEHDESFDLLNQEQQNSSSQLKDNETHESFDLLNQEQQNSSSELKDNKTHPSELELTLELLSLEEINRSAKQCPCCKMAITRIEGCHRVICTNCQQPFCYECNNTLDFGYDDDHEIHEPFVVRRHSGYSGYYSGYSGYYSGDSAHPCPKCGEINEKVLDDNHIFCSACKNHHCFLCRMMVKIRSQHFHPRGRCKRRTY